MTDSEFLHVNRAKIAHECVEGEVIIINVDDGSYYSLGEVAAALWGMIVQGQTLGGLRAWAQSRFPGDRDAIGSAVDRFVAELRAEEIVIAASSPPAHGGTLPWLDELVNGPAPAAFVPPALEKFTDIRDLLLLDPIHEVNEQGWPYAAPSDA